MIQTFEVGDVVRLVSGGVEMTVNAVIKADESHHEVDQATCVWHGEAGAPHSAGYSTASLELVDSASQRDSAKGKADKTAAADKSKAK